MPLVAGARLPLAFIVSGLLALLVGAVWLAADARVLLLPHVHPSVVALAHLWLPGFLLTVCFGACYQLMPVVLGAPLQTPLGAAWSHLGLHASGVALLVTGFACGNFAVVGLGGFLVSFGIALFAVTVWRTFTAGRRRDAIAWSLPLAATWLAATALIGVTLAIDRRLPFLPVVALDLLRAHAHAGLVGFFVTLLQGATFQLVPMFTLAELKHPSCVTSGLALSQAGLITLVPALACAEPRVITAAALLLGPGILCSGVALAATFRARRRRVLEPGLKAFALGAALLALMTAAGLAFTLVHGAGIRFAVSYGIAAVIGALSFTVLGMLCKIVPFLVWMRTYGPRAGRQPVPLATALGSKPLELSWLAAHATAITGLAAGALLGSAELLTIAAILLLVAVLLFIADMARIARHLFLPATPAPVRPAVFST